MSTTPPPPPGPPPPPPPGPPPGMPPGGGYGAPQPQQKPDSYLVWAILTTLFCCLPFGIVSIVYAAKVDGLWNGGDYAGAAAASENAKKWAIIAAVVGAVVGVLYAFIVFGVSVGSV